MHKWRVEEAAILVGTNTIIADDPLLTNRLWQGKNPVRLVIDKELKIAENFRVFNNEAPTIVFNYIKSTINQAEMFSNKVYFFKIEKNKSLVLQVIEACYLLNIQSILVEGGAKLLQSFIDEKLYDEIRIITNKDLVIGDGLNAPEFNGQLIKSFSEEYESDEIKYFL